MEQRTQHRPATVTGAERAAEERRSLFPRRRNGPGPQASGRLYESLCNRKFKLFLQTEQTWEVSQFVL